ncbi:MAG TPA: hypothetical protein PLG66_21840, partial [Calditrichia bacterium]|nr:hypothetical protein [Calditrichia bacterium]
VGLAKIPMIDETGIWPAPMVSPMGYMVNINLTGEKEQITLELLHFLTSEKNQLEFARRFNLIPARVSIQQDSVLLKDPFYQPAVDQMMVGKEMPVITEMRWVWDAMRPAYQSIFPGRISPEDAARQMQMEAEKLISENR